MIKINSLYLGFILYSIIKIMRLKIGLMLLLIGMVSFTGFSATAVDPDQNSMLEFSVDMDIGVEVSNVVISLEEGDFTIYFLVGTKVKTYKVYPAAVAKNNIIFVYQEKLKATQDQTLHKWLIPQPRDLS